MLNGNDKIKESVVYFMGIDKARFRKPVLPGDTLVIEAIITNMRRSVCQFDAKAYVRGELVCEASLMATVVAKNKSTLSSEKSYALASQPENQGTC